MEKNLQEAFELIINCCIEREEHIDQFEVYALKDAARQGIKAFDKTCKIVFGSKTGNLYCATIEKIREMIEFYCETLDTFFSTSENQVELILENINVYKGTLEVLEMLCEDSKICPFERIEENVTKIELLSKELVVRIKERDKKKQ